VAKFSFRRTPGALWKNFSFLNFEIWQTAATLMQLFVAAIRMALVGQKPSVANVRFRPGWYPQTLSSAPSFRG
jgi:hypothetical protein